MSRNPAVAIDGIWADETGPQTETLTIKFTVPGPIAQLQLERPADGKKGRLRIVSGVAKAGVSAGTYILKARGKTSMLNAPYEIEITTPASAAWKPDPARTSDHTATFVHLHTVTV